MNTLVLSVSQFMCAMCINVFKFSSLLLIFSFFFLLFFDFFFLCSILVNEKIAADVPFAEEEEKKGDTHRRTTASLHLFRTHSWRLKTTYNGARVRILLAHIRTHTSTKPKCNLKGNKNAWKIFTKKINAFNLGTIIYASEAKWSNENEEKEREKRIKRTIAKKKEKQEKRIRCLETLCAIENKKVEKKQTKNVRDKKWKWNRCLESQAKFDLLFFFFFVNFYLSEGEIACCGCVISSFSLSSSRFGFIENHRLSIGEENEAIEGGRWRRRQKSGPKRMR